MIKLQTEDDCWFTDEVLVIRHQVRDWLHDATIETDAGICN